MKTKKIDKKLNFKKVTISNLANPELFAIQGGVSIPFCVLKTEGCNFQIKTTDFNISGDCITMKETVRRSYCTIC